MNLQMCTDQKKCVQKMEIKHSISFFLQKVYSRTGKERGRYGSASGGTGTPTRRTTATPSSRRDGKTGDASGTHSIAGECQPPTSTGISDSVSEV